MIDDERRLERKKRDSVLEMGFDGCNYCNSWLHLWLVTTFALGDMKMNEWKHIKCSKCKNPVAISCTGYVHCIHCGTGNEPPFWYINP